MLAYTYKIYCVNNPEIFYIGSTRQKLSKRMVGHRTAYKRWLDGKVGKCMIYPYFQEYGIENFKIVELTRFEFIDRQQQLKMEQEQLDLYPNCVNKQGAHRDCPHGRQHSYCKECGGVSICEHNREKSRCKECGGSQICEHNRIKSNCKDCGGSQICEHNRQKSRCKECGGSQICEHNREKSRCKECGGSQICEHNREKSRCKECGGVSICEHNRIKSRCKECGGVSICEHNRIKSQCKECNNWYCDYCEKKYSNKALLYKHLLSHF